MPLRFIERVGGAGPDSFTVANPGIAFGLRGDDRFDVARQADLSMAMGGPGNDTYTARDNGALTVFDTGGDDTIEASGIGLTRASSFAATLQDGQHVVAADNQSGQVVYLMNWREPAFEIETIELADTTLSIGEAQTVLPTLPGFRGDMDWQDFEGTALTNDAVNEALQFYENREQELLGTTGGDTPDGGMTAVQGRTFISEGGSVTVSERVEVFGRAGGDEAVSIERGVRGAELDANIEQIEVPQSLDAYTFQVTVDGLEVTTNGNAVFTAPSVNQDVTLSFADGDATLSQTGAAQFELTGPRGAAPIGDTPTSPDLDLEAVNALGLSPHDDAI